jgi:hypothetical protein
MWHGAGFMVSALHARLCNARQPMEAMWPSLLSALARNPSRFDAPSSPSCHCTPGNKSTHALPHGHCWWQGAEERLAAAEQALDEALEAALEQEGGWEGPDDLDALEDGGDDDDDDDEEEEEEEEVLEEDAEEGVEEAAEGQKGAPSAAAAQETGTAGGAGFCACPSVLVAWAWGLCFWLGELGML